MSNGHDSEGKRGRTTTISYQKARFLAIKAMVRRQLWALTSGNIYVGSVNGHVSSTDLAELDSSGMITGASSDRKLDSCASY